MRALSGEQAARGLPVVLHATVLYYDPYITTERAVFFVHDRTGGLFVFTPTHPVLPIREGSEVEISGVTGSGEFAPVVSTTGVRLLGQGKVPSNPQKVTVSEMMTGALDSQWVQLEGVVRAVTPQGGNMVLRFATSDGFIGATTARVPGFDYDRLIGAEGTLDAVAATHFNKRRQVTGVHVFFASLQDLHLRHYGVADPFGLPVRSISEIARFEEHASVADRVHIRGRVTLQWPSQLTCIQDLTGGICVDTADQAPLPTGSEVEAVGFPTVSNATPMLSDATLRRVGAELAPPVATRITSEAAAEGLYSSNLVEMDGEMVGVSKDPARQAIMISSGGHIFPAILPARGGVVLGDRLREGSQVRVRGICSAQASTHGVDDRQGLARFESFSILLQTPNDIIVLETPSWWTPAHAASTLAVASCALLLFSGWIALLRRQVARQTLQLRESEERFRHLAQHDPLTGLANRALLHDRLQVAIEQAKRTGTSLGLLMIDLDRFKQVNDTLGHAGGDQLLCAAAERILSSVRRSDTVARMGGDEFVVLLSNLKDRSEAQAIAREIMGRVATPVLVGSKAVPVSASIGICVFPEDGTESRDILLNADTALYQAKAAGRNCCQSYSQTVVTLSEGTNVQQAVECT